MHTLRIALVVWLFTVVSCVTAPKDMSDADLSDEVYRLSGIQESLDSLPSSISSSLDEKLKQGKLPEKSFDALSVSMRTHFSPSEMRKVVHSALASGLERKDKISIINFYRSESGQKVREAELYMNTAEGQAAFETYMGKIQAEQVQISKEEIEFAKELAIHTGALALTVEVVGAVTTGMLVGLNSSMPEGKRMSTAQLNQQLSSVKEALYESLAPAIILTMHFTYKDVNKKHKAAMLAFLKNQSGKKFITTIAMSLNKGFSTAARKVGSSLAKDLAH